MKNHPLGQGWFSPVDVVLDRRRDLVVQPDFVVVANRNLHIVEDRIWGAPDLVLDVLSPRPRIGELDERLQWFAHYGVGECWLFHQRERRLEALTFADGAIAARRSFQEHERIYSGVLPAFELSIAAIVEE